MKKPKKVKAATDLLELGRAYHRAGRLSEAMAQYGKALERSPDNPDVLHLIGLTHSQAGDYAAAIRVFEHTLTVRESAPSAVELGKNYTLVKHFAEAVSALRLAVRLDPRHAVAWTLLGNALISVRQLPDAALALRRAVELDSRSLFAHCLLGTALHMLRNPAESAAVFRAALALSPDLPDAHAGLGNALFEQGRFEEALEACANALRLQPERADAYVLAGAANLKLRRFEQAAAALGQAVRLAPDNPVHKVSLGVALGHLGRDDEAAALWRQAMAQSADGLGAALCDLINDLLTWCRWDCIHEVEDRVLDLVRAGSKEIIPLTICWLPKATSQDQLTCARNFSLQFQVSDHRLPPRTPDPAAHRIRVGYMSSDFREHAVSFLLAGVIEHHDRERFEVTAYSIGPGENTETRRRLEAGFDRFVEVGALSDQQIAETIRRDGIDILVDLNGYTQGARVGVFPFRPAPIQVNFLGYPCTMGSDAYDYILADRWCLPPSERPYFSEKVAYLPSYQPNDSRRRLAATPPRRDMHGLPDQGFVFACFNGAYKITPDFFAVWMRLLKAVPGSVLWLRGSGDRMFDNLRRMAEAQGVAGERLVRSINVAGYDEHLARMACADLFLDTLPYNAHTTASDALFAGLPVLTCTGGTFAGRVAGSVLSVLGVPELITASLEEYEAQALRLANDPAALAAIRAKILKGRDASPLFDTARYTRTLEQAYSRMWQRWQAGQEPADFDVTEENAASEAQDSAAAPTPTAPAHLLEARRELVRLLMTLDSAPAVSLPELFARYRAVQAAGLPDEALDPAAAAELARLQAAPASLPAYLAKALYRRPWLLDGVPALGALPHDLAAELLDVMMAPPAVAPAAAELDAYAAFLTALAQQAAQMGAAVPGHAAARRFVEKADLSRVLAAARDLRPLVQARARVIEDLAHADWGMLDWAPPPRAADRVRLRVGILAHGLGADGATAALLPYFADLDRSRFEVVLYSLTRPEAPWLEVARALAEHVEVLPEGVPEAVGTVRGHDLDVLVAAADLAALPRAATITAHRLARMQVAGFPSVLTTGLGTMDAHLAGTLAEPAPDADTRYGEVLVRLDGAGFCLAPSVGAPSATPQPSRDSLGLAGATAVFATGADFTRVGADTRDAWADILARVPGAVLVVYQVGAAMPDPAAEAAFFRAVERSLLVHGLGSDRVQYVRGVATHHRAKALLSVADIYLDSFPLGTPFAAMAALELGLPVVARRGDSARAQQGAAMLLELGLPELAAGSDADYVAQAVRLAADPGYRAATAARVQAGMARNPAFANPVTFARRFAAGLSDAVQKVEAARRKDILRF